jgi:hypothetical protein
MSGSYTPLPPSAFAACIGTALASLLSFYSKFIFFKNISKLSISNPKKGQQLQNTPPPRI